jgi:hypothetical protein
MNRSLCVRSTMVEDGRVRDLVIVDGVVADATPLPSREPDAAGWVLAHDLDRIPVPARRSAAQ